MSKSTKYNLFPFNYCGNKYQETKKLIKSNLLDMNFEKYDIIAEPLCGIFGFSRLVMEYNPNFKGEFWFNDINSGHIKLLKDILFDTKETKKYLLDLFEKYAHLNDTDLNRIFREESITSKYFTSSMSYVKFKENLKRKIDMISEENTKKYNNFKIKFFNMNSTQFIDLLEAERDKNIFIYFDPPYMNSNTSPYHNEKEKRIFNNKEYDKRVDISEIYLDIFLCKQRKPNNIDCLLVINKLALINYLFNDCLIYEYPKLYQMKKNYDLIGVYKF